MDKREMNELLEKKKKFQQELNKVLSSYLSEDELKEVKQLIADYYARKVAKEMDKLAAERGWTQETYDEWLKEHTRTPYKNYR